MAPATISRRSAIEIREWLREKPSLNELREAFPGEWRTVERELNEIVARGDLDELRAYAATVSAPPKMGAKLARLKAGEQALLGAQIRSQMASAALKQLLVAAATGVPAGQVRLNLFNGFIAQKLLFARDLERKPVSQFRFRALWPLLWQGRRLMPLVEPKGIYCFYSRKLIDALAALIDTRSCLEIAAGDGTLAGFLADRGVAITATDDHSWRASVTYPETVRNQDARAALRTYRPEVVICSWRPAGNAFEQHVFATASVQTYIVIASRHEFAAGNFSAYRVQAAFTFCEESALSRLVLPPELDPAVFHRTARSGGGARDRRAAATAAR